MIIQRAIAKACRENTSDMIQRYLKGSDSGVKKRNGPSLTEDMRKRST